MLRALTQALEKIQDRTSFVYEAARPELRRSVPVVTDPLAAAAAEPAVVVRGRMLDADRNPVAGVVTAHTSCHRGGRPSPTTAGAHMTSGEPY